MQEQQRQIECQLAAVQRELAAKQQQEAAEAEAAEEESQQKNQQKKFTSGNSTSKLQEVKKEEGSRGVQFSTPACSNKQQPIKVVALEASSGAAKNGIKLLSSEAIKEEKEENRKTVGDETGEKSSKNSGVVLTVAASAYSPSSRKISITSSNNGGGTAVIPVKTSSATLKMISSQPLQPLKIPKNATINIISKVAAGTIIKHQKKAAISTESSSSSSPQHSVLPVLDGHHNYSATLPVSATTAAATLVTV